MPAESMSHTRSRRARPWILDDTVPRRGDHYPADGAMFEKWFGTEIAARRYLAAVRWRHGLECPRCGSPRFGANGTSAEPRWWCGDCRRAVTVTSGTLLDHHRLPLTTILQVAWWWAHEPVGFSTRALTGWLGVHENSAGRLAQTLRVAMRGPHPPLRGLVEIDDVAVGIHEPVGRSSLRTQRIRVLLAVGCPGQQRIGSIRLAKVSSVSAVTVGRFLRRQVASGSVVVTDRSRSMAGALITSPYSHRPDGLGLTDPWTHRPLVRCHSVAERLNSWLSEIHGGAVDHRHLPLYLDEFSFRFNRRHTRDRGRVWFDLVERLLHTPVEHRRPGPRVHPKKPTRLPGAVHVLAPITRPTM